MSGQFRPGNFLLVQLTSHPGAQLRRTSGFPMGELIMDRPKHGNVGPSLLKEYF
ncbi:MAG TPA: hypothetical protein VI306_00360 [Pyrinomonadaceae bacterium]